MGDRTKIEWTEATWNPIRARDLAPGTRPGPGYHCEIITPGCEHCYAQRINLRLGTHRAYLRRERERVRVFIEETSLMQPLRWRRSRNIFVCSMSDLFGEWVSDEMIDRVFAIMALTPRHTFQVLTKRAERMRDYLSSHDVGCRWAQEAYEIKGGRLAATPAEAVEWTRRGLRNVWLGVSVEDQRRANERIPALLDTPAAVRWVSAEPLLGPIDLANPLAIERAGYRWRSDGTRPALDWVVCGGESGPEARPMLSAWARSLRDQCVAASVPFFFKQWGEWVDADLPLNYAKAESLTQTGHTNVQHHSDGSTVIRVGKRAAGRMLDRREWNEYPKIAPKNLLEDRQDKAITDRL